MPRYSTRPTRDLKPGDKVVDFFKEGDEGAQQVADELNRLNPDLYVEPRPVTASDIADAERWPVAVVEAPPAATERVPCGAWEHETLGGYEYAHRYIVAGGKSGPSIVCRTHPDWDRPVPGPRRGWLVAVDASDDPDDEQTVTLARGDADDEGAAQLAAESAALDLLLTAVSTLTGATVEALRVACGRNRP